MPTLMSRRLLFTILCCTMLIRPQPAPAAVRLPHIFGTNMVLQQGVTLPVWGWAAPAEKVTVAIAGQQQTTVTDAAGQWRIQLEPLHPGTPLEMRVRGENELLLSNILVGEVWLCSGQSNMAFPLRATSNGQAALAEANRPELRLFQVKDKYLATDPQPDVEGEWVVCTPESAAPFSAVGYFFGGALQEQLHCPVGLIQSAVGGTVIQSWMDAQTLTTMPGGDQCLADWELQQKKLMRQQQPAQSLQPSASPDFSDGMARQLKLNPQEKAYRRLMRNRPSSLFNGMIYPLAPYPLRGVIWYQGEGNASRGDQLTYRQLLPGLIGNWRQRWGVPEMPFLFVQLPNFSGNAEGKKIEDGLWATMRDSMMEVTRSTPHTGMAVTIDLGTSNNIHPPNKQPVGERLALVARHEAYGEQLVYCGPVYEKMKLAGETVEISFQHCGAGLVAKGDKLSGFEMAAEDQKFYPAEARIEQNRVIVSSPALKNPVAVRYGWANDPVVNLYNQEGLPAAPFRTDNWELK